MREKVEKVLNEKVRPQLELHNGIWMFWTLRAEWSASAFWGNVLGVLRHT